jgi:hypothetical protein
MFRFETCVFRLHLWRVSVIRNSCAYFERMCFVRQLWTHMRHVFVVLLRFFRKTLFACLVLSEFAL